MAKLTNHAQRTRVITSSTDKHYSLDSVDDFRLGFEIYKVCHSNKQNTPLPLSPKRIFLPPRFWVLTWPAAIRVFLPTTRETEKREPRNKDGRVLALREQRNIQNAVFCEESLGNNHALYVYLTYKDVNRFWKCRFTNYIYCLKACKRSEVHVLSCEITNEQCRSSKYENIDKKTINNEVKRTMRLGRTPQMLKKLRSVVKGTSQMRQSTCNWIKRMLNEATWIINI